MTTRRMLRTTATGRQPQRTRTALDNFSAISARSAVAVAAAAVLFTLAPRAAEKKVRIIQTNSAGDNVHIIDPATNKVVGVIEGIEVNHGAAAAPDGTRIYVSNEADSTLDIVDSQTLKVVKKVPLSGHPKIGRAHV